MNQLAVRNFSVGQVVYAKIKGYPPWPAIITHMPTAKKARVTYFNSGQHNDLSIEKLTSLRAGIEIERKYYGKNHAFTKAFNEMQVVAQATVKKKEKKPQIIVHLLSPDEIKRIQSDLKKNKKPTKQEAKNRLRSGRFY